MNLISTILLVLGVASLYIGLRQWWLTLKALPIMQGVSTPWLQYGQKLFLWMGVSGIGLGLLALALVFGTDANPVLSFIFPIITVLALLWVLTAATLLRDKKVSPVYEPMMITNLILFVFPVVFGLYLGLETIAPALTYPLPKGIPFANPVVTFYAVFILSGAFLAYTVADYSFVKLGKKKGFVEDVFIIAFPAGILGARLWYVWGQWSLEFADQPLWKIFAIWEGGLAIMGGALGGALAGIVYVLLKRKDINIVQAIDIGVPTILLAQAIGRWGNFFNQEVYGAIADVDQWMWLPTFIREQITINGSFRVPLFFIESMINLTGFFVIRYGVGRGLQRFIRPGDQALMYLVWYGLTRGIMEPLRNPLYNMGNAGAWSLIWGWVFFATGLLAILSNHLVIPRLKK
ncbi:MAG: prolipoprotein diacylglyceryl transferase [Bacilli bacterium]